MPSCYDKNNTPLNVGNWVSIDTMGSETEGSIKKLLPHNIVVVEDEYGTEHTVNALNMYQIPDTPIL